jgi:hypothetical protein
MNLLLPPGIAGIIFIITGAIESGDHSDTDLLGGLAVFPYILVVSYLYAIIPSAICTSLMEYLYRRRSLSPNSRKALYASALCGTLASLIMASPFFIASLTGGLGSKPENQGHDNLRSLVILLALGTTTGLLTGVVIKLTAERGLRLRANK